ncbi:hypothetical protein FQN57_004067 [Myotisia sp. PD_48]|nr:hypothetical protein FQN57_004067 [Myotisia sp. PD_48]
MHLATVSCLSFAAFLLNTCGTAALARDVPLFRQMVGSHNTDLNKRQECSSSNTCGECFGEDWVMCSGQGCFNPKKKQHCCANGSFCVAKDNSCCDPYGPGETGKDGTPTKASTTPSAESPSGTSWTCTRKDSGEDCCQRGGKDIHYCSGEFPYQLCYNHTLQTCCDEGTICEGDDCCDIVGAKPVSTFPGSVSTGKTTSASETGIVFPTTGRTAAPTPSAEETSESVESTTATSTNVAPGLNGVIGGMAGIAMGVFGLAMI